MSMVRMATTTVTVKRASLVGGKKEQSSAAAVLTDLPCTLAIPLDPNQGNALAQEPTIKSVFAVYQTYVPGIHDIRQGDTVEVDSVGYTVKAVSKWQRGRSPYTQVTMERINQ